MFPCAGSCTLSALVFVGLLAACSPDPEGLATSGAGNGPMVVWDLSARPLPEIPFPNDLATRYDPDSPTGRRLNLSLISPTEIESETREKVDRLDGFGTFGAITVTFDALLDLADLRERHVGNRDFQDDAVYLVDVTSGSPTYGEPVMLDMGTGFFPLQLKVTDAYFSNDPRAEGTNLVFETYNELGEDTDFDGVDDRPNLFPGGDDPWDDLLTHYEMETHALMLRPVVPLRERTRYAVVITRRLLGAEGTGRQCSTDGECPDTGSCDEDAGRCREPVRSPFRWVNHTRQTQELAPLKSILTQDLYGGLGVDEVAFAWVFTTQSVTSALTGIRKGLYGHGPFAYLAEEFPAELTLSPAKTSSQAAKTGSMYTVAVQELLDTVGPLLEMLKGTIPSLEESFDPLMESYEHVDYFVAGTFQSPDFLTDRDGHAAEGHPADDDESFEVDPETGDAVYGSTTVPFICIIPKEQPDYRDETYPRHTGRKPFPVAIFMHGTASSKLQAMGFAGLFARFGIATCAIDAFAHGMPFPANPAEGALLSEPLVLDMIELLAHGYLPIYHIIKGTRCRDLNMDGNLDPAGDFWTLDAFHTRDAIRQTTVDLMQFLRTLRAMNGETRHDMDGDGVAEVLGDFDGDGEPDLGGSDNRYYAYGISLGGIVTGVFAGVEPALDAAVVIAGGGGLSDVAVRSTNPGVPEMAIMPMMGPIILGDPEEEAGGAQQGVVLSFAMPAFDRIDELPIMRLVKAKPGFEVRLTNLDSGESTHAVVPGEGGFRLQLQGDALRATEIRHFTGFDPLARVEVDSCADDADCPKGWRCRKIAAETCCMMAPPRLDTRATGDRPALGDFLLVEVIDREGNVVESVDTFGYDVEANGIIYPEGARLVNMYRGYGYARQTPGLRRFMNIAQAILEPGDPVNWARHYAAQPLAYPEADPDATPGTSVTLLLSAGDSNVPVAAGVSLARAAGIVGYADADGRYGEKSQMEVLVENGVVEGLYNRCRYVVDVEDKEGDVHEECVLYDVDDLDGSRHHSGCGSCAYEYDAEETTVLGWLCTDGEGEACGDGFDAPYDLPEPLRATAAFHGTGPAAAVAPAACEEKNPDGSCRFFRDENGVQAARFVMTRPWGFHGLYLMAPYKAFDIETYQLNFIVRYFISSGQEVWDSACLEDSSCEWMP